MFAALTVTTVPLHSLVQFLPLGTPRPLSLCARPVLPSVGKRGQRLAGTGHTLFQGSASGTHHWAQRNRGPSPALGVLGPRVEQGWGQTSHTPSAFVLGQQGRLAVAWSQALSDKQAL